MHEQVAALIEEYESLQRQLGDLAFAANPAERKRIGKRMREIEPAIPPAREYMRCQEALKEVETARNDPELLTIAEEEAESARLKLPALQKELHAYLIPRNPDDSRPVILEVRAGTGGEEAALFAADLLRMYLRYAEEQGWQTELLGKSDAEAGGIREAIVRIPNAGAYGKLKFESGVHRVQRVPLTESKGRIHTSAASVAILPEAENADIRIRPEDLKVDVFRSSGPGGQSVNTTDSAVRITHLPTGTVVSCQDEKSQLKNRTKALTILRSRLFAAERERRARERGQLRSSQIGTGDRSEKIRTYNFPQYRVTDHRIKRSFSNLPAILDGSLDEIIGALQRR